MALPGGALASRDEEDDEDLADAAPAGNAPFDLSPGSRMAAVQPPAPAPRAGPSVAATGSGDARADYDAAYAFLLQNQYEQAEMGFRRFLQSHPRDRLVPDATYWLGESYLRRSRHREAAEQFLTMSTEHASSPKAPDAMLKLGIALNALGARDRACAVFAELDRKYPQAGARQGSEREQKRARCV
jgi:tol-pal system protein YbgF